MTPHQQKKNILIWLPSPVGDAVMSIPSLRALRQYYSDKKIYFICSSTVRQALWPCTFADGWIDYSGSLFRTIIELRKYKFSRVILLKNSFGSALISFLSGIDKRIGYNRDCRGFFLTDKLNVKKDCIGKYTPISTVDYYLDLCKFIGCQPADLTLGLDVDPVAANSLHQEMPFVKDTSRPVVVLVPAGAFGPSKCWQPEKFAQTADWLIDNYNANVVISVAPTKTECRIADAVCSVGKNKFHSLAESPISLGQLKALINVSDLVITNDTGPRHLAIALGKKVVTIFGPNNPSWTKTDYENEIQIQGTAPCVPCDKPICTQKQHLCMDSISVEDVTAAAQKLLKQN